MVAYRKKTYKGKKRPYRRKRVSNRRKGVTGYQAYKLAKKANYDMIPMKRHPYDGTLALNDSEGAQGVLIQPTMIAANDNVGAAGINELSQRNTNLIYLERCSGVFNLRPFSTMVNPIHVRKICGWWKGVNGQTADGPDPGDLALQASDLDKTFTNRLARYDSSNYKIIEDKFFTIIPDNVIDNNGSDDRTGQEQFMGLWKPVMVKCNFRFHRKFLYADGKQRGPETEISKNNNSVVGWKPFIYLQARCPLQQYTHTDFVEVDYKFTSYFKDVQ